MWTIVAHAGRFRVYCRGQMCWNCDQINLYNRPRHLSSRAASFRAPLISNTATLISPTGPPAQTRNNHIPRWTNTHTHTMYTYHVALMAPDLIFLLPAICAERHDALKRGESDPLFWRMKWKAHVATICQSKQRFNGGSDERGDFLTVFPLKLHGRREGWREGKKEDCWDM